MKKKMDLPFRIKKEEPVEYFLITSSEGQIDVPAFDKYSNDVNSTVNFSKI